MFLCETHLHTKGNSICALTDVDTIASTYKAAGYDGIVCTNHFNPYIYHKWFGLFSRKSTKIARYLSGYYALRAACEKVGITVYFGMELALRGDVYGVGRGPWAEQLIFGMTPAEFTKYNTALYKMSYQQLHDTAVANGWVIVQAHPSRDDTKKLDTRYLDGAEVFNGHPGHVERNEQSLDFAEKNHLLFTAGSDFHFVGAQSSGIIFDSAPIDEKDFAAKIKAEAYKLQCKMGVMPDKLV